MVNGSTPQLECLGVQRASDTAGKAGAVQKDAGALVFPRAQVGLVVVLVHLEVALLAEPLIAVLPVLVGKQLDRLFQVGDVVLVRHERAVRTAPVVGSALDGSLAGGRAEHTRPPREQPRHVGGDQMFRVVGIVKLHPLTGKVEFNLTGMRCAHKIQR
jgi:hypothetical protein